MMNMRNARSLATARTPYSPSLGYFTPDGFPWHCGKMAYIANSRTQIAPAARISVAATESAYVQSIRSIELSWNRIGLRFDLRQAGANWGIADHLAELVIERPDSAII
jgi:hypothetical protein